MFVYSILAIIAKGVVSILIAIDKIPYNETLFKTFGIPIIPHDYSASRWLPTFFADLGALVCEIFLLVITHEALDYSEDENNDIPNHVPVPKDLAKHY